MGRSSSDYFMDDVGLMILEAFRSIDKHDQVSMIHSYGWEEHWYKCHVTWENVDLMDVLSYMLYVFIYLQVTNGHSVKMRSSRDFQWFYWLVFAGPSILGLEHKS